MTQTEKLCKAERWRIDPTTYGWDGRFLVPLDGELWLVLLGGKDGDRTLDVVNAKVQVQPTFMVMHQLRDLFFDDDVHVVQIYPPTNGVWAAPIDLYQQQLWEVNETFIDAMDYFTRQPTLLGASEKNAD